MRMIQRGKTHREVADRLHVSRARAHQLYKKALLRTGFYDRIEKSQKPYLSTRALSCLMRLGYTESTKKEINKAIREGQIHYNNKESKGLGRQTFREICQWAGISNWQSMRRDAARPAKDTTR